MYKDVIITLPNLKLTNTPRGSHPHRSVDLPGDLVMKPRTERLGHIIDKGI